MHRVEIIAPFQSWLPIDHQPTASLARNKAPQKKTASVTFEDCQEPSRGKLKVALYHFRSRSSERFKVAECRYRGAVARGCA
jgi:hypothetical protein